MYPVYGCKWIHGIYIQIYIYIHNLIIISPWFSGWSSSLPRSFSSGGGPHWHLRNRHPRSPKNESRCIQVWWQLYLCSRAQLWSFYRWSNVEAIKSDDLQNFRAKKKPEILQNEEVVLWSLDAVYCTQISLHTRSWQWHTRYVQEWFQERSSSRILNWRSSWDAEDV